MTHDEEEKLKIFVECGEGHRVCTSCLDHCALIKVTSIHKPTTLVCAHWECESVYSTSVYRHLSEGVHRVLVENSLRQVASSPFEKMDQNLKCPKCSFLWRERKREEGMLEYISTFSIAFIILCRGQGNETMVREARM